MMYFMRKQQQKLEKTTKNFFLLKNQQFKRYLIGKSIYLLQLTFYETINKKERRTKSDGMIFKKIFLFKIETNSTKFK